MRLQRPILGIDRDLGWWVAVLFMAGSTVFALGSFPPYSQNVDPGVVGSTFFVGSLLFTSAAAAQLVQINRQPPDTGGCTRQLDWWASIVQLVGTLLFNVSTFAAMADGLSTEETNRLVWAPDVFGSIAFISASALAWRALGGTPAEGDRGSDEWRIAVLNGVGSIVFMISAIAALTLPTTGEVLNTTLVNLGTFVGAICFLWGAYLLLPVRRPAGVQQPG